MKKIFIAGVALCSFNAISAKAAQADMDFYAKASVSFELESEGTEDYTAVNSNASWVGVKGSAELNSTFDAIYQMEYQVSIDGDDDTFLKRDIYVGLSSNFGSIIAGHFITPLKRAQGDVDLFNDLHGDIRQVITKNDNRKSNSLMYISPEVFDSVTVYVDYISPENETLEGGVSVAATYSAGDLYLAAAADSNVEAQSTSAARFVAQYSLWRLSAGLLVERHEGIFGDVEEGWLVSLKCDLNPRWVAKAQVGASDIIYAGGETLSLGGDYKVGEQAKVFGFYTWQSADRNVLDNDYLGAGVEVRF